MDLNHKQKELIENLLKAVISKFPEIKFRRLTSSPDDPRDIWIIVTAPNDEEREIELSAFSSELETDILLDYGYSLAIMPLEKDFYNGPVTDPWQQELLKRIA